MVLAAWVAAAVLVVLAVHYRSLAVSSSQLVTVVLAAARSATTASPELVPGQTGKTMAVMARLYIQVRKTLRRLVKITTGGGEEMEEMAMLALGSPAATAAMLAAHRLPPTPTALTVR